jgi:hypothetical protein
MRFNHRECLAEIAQALAPILAKHKHRINPDVLAQLDEGLINEYEALSTIIDASIAQVIDDSFKHPNARPN